MDFRKTDQLMGKRNPNTLLYKKKNSKWIQELNIKEKYQENLEEILSEYLYATQGKKNLTMRLQFQRNIQKTLRAFEFKYMLSTTKKGER